MDFAPLKWVMSTLTYWHFAIWIVFFLLCLWPRSDIQTAMDWSIWLWVAVVVPPFLYCWVGPIVGQIFGEKFAWSQLWPTGLVAGGMVSTFYVVGILGSAWNERSAGLAIVAIPVWLFATVFFGLFVAATSWVAPRVVGAGMIEFPKASWGVTLPPSP